MHRSKRSVLATGVVLGLGLGLSSVADARTGDPLREGVRNGTTTRETRVIGDIDNRYTTRQSNKSGTGGGAIYGCRSTAALTTKPCIRANNLSTGRAFEFSTVSGLLGGIISVGGGGDTRRPFTTNATGVATGLNADRVDGLEAAQLRTRWALINEAGAIEAQSGGFSVTSAFAGANPNVYINTGGSLEDKGLSATVAGQNQIDRGAGAPGPDPNFGGSVTVSRCATASTVCAPPGTNDANHLVLSPRIPTAPAGGGPITFEATTPTTRLRFYVTVTG
jgi:hypothetical protein